MLNNLSQAVRKPQEWMITHTGDLWYPSVYTAYLCDPTFSAPGSPFPLLSEMAMAFSSGFSFYSVSSDSFSLCSLVSCEILTGKQPWPHLALLSPTHMWFSSTVQHQGCQTGWTPRTHCDYNLAIWIINMITEATQSPACF